MARKLGDVDMTIEKRGGAYEIVSDGETRARWKVPWSLRRDTVVRLSNELGRKDEVVVWTGDFDPRSQEFEVGDATYRWKHRSSREIVLEKRSPGTGRYVVGLFYLKVRGWCTHTHRKTKYGITG